MNTTTTTNQQGEKTMSENTTEIVKPKSIEQQAAELRRMQEAEEQRIKAENDAKEAARIAQEAKDKEEREETERKDEQARAEALKPDIEKAQAWFDHTRESIPVVPQIADQKIAAGLQSARKAILAKIIEEDFLPF